MIIKIEAFPNGGHSNQSLDIFPLPEGWAFVPPELDTPDTFPFVDIDVNVVDGVLTVVNMRAGVVPEPAPEPEPVPTPEERIAELEEALTETQLALCEQYENNLALSEEITNNQLALCELYETIGGLI